MLKFCRVPPEPGEEALVLRENAPHGVARLLLSHLRGMCFFLSLGESV